MSDRDAVHKTLDALVEEAYQHALERGLAITNPDGWRAWKRSVYIATAKREGPGYLRKHHQRLGLGTTPRRDPITCAKCGASIVTLTHTDDDPTTPYCSYACAGIKTMSLTEWLATATPEQRSTMERFRRHQEGAA